VLGIAWIVTDDGDVFEQLLQRFEIADGDGISDDQHLRQGGRLEFGGPGPAGQDGVNFCGDAVCPFGVRVNQVGATWLTRGMTSFLTIVSLIPQRSP